MAICMGPALLLLLPLLSEIRPHLLREARFPRVGSEKGFVGKVGVGYSREFRISLGGLDHRP